MAVLFFLAFLVNLGFCQLIDLPPELGFGTVDVTGRLTLFSSHMDELAMDTTGKLSFDAGTTHVSLKLVGGQTIQAWFSHHPTPGSKSREAWVESVDYHLPEYDECRTMTFPEETFICQNWLNYGEVLVNDEKLIQWSRSCGFRQDPKQFRHKDFLAHVFRIHLQDTSDDPGAEEYACPFHEAQKAAEHQREEEKARLEEHAHPGVNLTELGAKPHEASEQQEVAELEYFDHLHDDPGHVGKYMGSYRYDIWTTLDGKITTIQASMVDHTGVVSNLVIHPASDVVKAKPDSAVFTPCKELIMRHRHHEL